MKQHSVLKVHTILNYSSPWQCADKCNYCLYFVPGQSYRGGWLCWSLQARRQCCSEYEQILCDNIRHFCVKLMKYDIGEHFLMHSVATFLSDTFSNNISFQHFNKHIYCCNVFIYCKCNFEDTGLQTTSQTKLKNLFRPADVSGITLLFSSILFHFYFLLM